MRNEIGGGDGGYTGNAHTDPPSLNLTIIFIYYL